MDELYSNERSSLRPGDDPVPAFALTGASGFLGRAVLRESQASGWSARAVGRAGGRPPSRVLSREQGQWVTADLGDPETLRGAFVGTSTVIHAAGLAHRPTMSSLQSLPSYQQTNVTGTENVVRAAVEAGVRRVIVVSSAAVYPASSGEASIDESTPPGPVDDYGRSKWEAEQRARDVAGASGLRLIVVRPVTVIGEGDPGNLLRLIRSIDRRRFLPVGSGRNVKSLIYREDAARAIVVLATMPELPKRDIYNLVTIHAPVDRIVQAIRVELGRRPSRLHLPAQFAAILESRAWRAVEPPPLASLRIGIRKWLADIRIEGSAFAEEIGWSERPIDLEESIRREVAWYRSGCPEQA